MRVLNILIIDDNEAHCTGLAELLSLRGLRTQCAFTGEQGVGLALAAPPDAILLDLHLPDISGHIVCDRLRSSPLLDRTAILFHTASSHLDRSSSADALLTYPVSTTDLVFVIQGCVSRRNPDLTNS